MRAKQTILIALILAAIIASLVGISIARRAWMFDAERAQAVAMQLCSCVFVSGRPEADCSSDFPSDSLLGLTLEIIDDTARVSGSGQVAQARYGAMEGCRLVETR